MATAVVEKMEGKLVAAVPPELDVAEGDAVEIERNREECIPRIPRQYSLEQLIAEHEQIADQLEEDRAWLDAPRVGRELI